MKNKIDLLIIFTDGTEHVVHDVDEYGILNSSTGMLMYYIKNDHRNFIPTHAIRYIGSYANYHEEESV